MPNIGVTITPTKEIQSEDEIDLKIQMSALYIYSFSVAFTSNIGSVCLLVDTVGTCDL
jgi:hypothetical protein